MTGTLNEGPLQYLAKSAYALINEKTVAKAHKSVKQSGVYHWDVANATISDTWNKSFVYWLDEVDIDNADDVSSQPVDNKNMESVKKQCIGLMARNA